MAQAAGRKVNPMHDRATDVAKATIGFIGTFIIIIIIIIIILIIVIIIIILVRGQPSTAPLLQHALPSRAFMHARHSKSTAEQTRIIPRRVTNRLRGWASICGARQVLCSSQTRGRCAGDPATSARGDGSGFGGEQGGACNKVALLQKAGNEAHCET